jgi:8-oxo-dGTP diphosphatase
MKQKWDGVKGIVRKDGLVLVLVKENGHLDLPGGRVEKGETVKSALRREINEETGLQVEINDPVHKWSFHKTQDHLIKGITFQCRYLNGRVTLSDEHERYFWARISEIERLHYGYRFFRNSSSYQASKNT